ncbi:MAG: hypothetical protein JWO86_9079 [Myxococcaceae bacterium]|nr:hypothetical protein [Myxococcaceae bacterium]
MRPARIIVSSVVAAIVGVVVASTSASAQSDAGASSLPACIGVGTEARYVPYGYNHIVLLKNGCSKAATCSVSTDVNPQPTAVEVASATNVEVLTFTASPAQTFHARVTCKLH